MLTFLLSANDVRPWRTFSHAQNALYIQLSRLSSKLCYRMWCRYWRHVYRTSYPWWIWTETNCEIFWGDEVSCTTWAEGTGTRWLCWLSELSQCCWLLRCCIIVLIRLCYYVASDYHVRWDDAWSVCTWFSRYPRSFTRVSAFKKLLFCKYSNRWIHYNWSMATSFIFPKGWWGMGGCICRFPCVLQFLQFWLNDSRFRYFLLFLQTLVRSSKLEWRCCGIAYGPLGSPYSVERAAWRDHMSWVSTLSVQSI